MQQSQQFRKEDLSNFEARVLCYHQRRIDNIYSRTLTCVTQANLRSLVDIAVAKVLIVDKWSKEIAACSRIRVFTFGLVHKTR